MGEFAKSGKGKIAALPEEINLRPFEIVLKNTLRLATGNYDDKNCWEEVERGELDAITFGRCLLVIQIWWKRLGRGRG